MAKTKTAKKVKVKIAIAFDEKGHYDTEGGWNYGARPTDETLLRDLRGVSDYLYFCIAEVSLPQPPKGKVLKVKKMKP